MTTTHANVDVDDWLMPNKAQMAKMSAFFVSMGGSGFLPTQLAGGYWDAIVWLDRRWSGWTR